MKILKKIILGFLNLLLLNLIILLTISINLKNFISDGIIKETIKEQIVVIPYQESPTDSNVESEQINKILENKETEALVDKYINLAISGITDEKNLSKINLEEDMLKYLKNNKELLEKELGLEITDEIVEATEESLKSKELSESFKQSISNASKNISPEERFLLKAYSFLTSRDFKILVLVLITLDLILIGIIQKSYYKWLKSLGISLILSGLGTLFMSMAVKAIVVNLSPLKEFNIKSLTYSSIILMVVGIILSIVQIFIDKKYKIQGESTDEVSEISNA